MYNEEFTKSTNTGTYIDNPPHLPADKTKKNQLIRHFAQPGKKRMENSDKKAALCKEFYSAYFQYQKFFFDVITSNSAAVSASGTPS
ncbi:hypothetical protein S2091_0029 [Solimicrobium silvestre]|uniref:Uncharacterized protein n=1 Tax=Solimicrobium silvestre TaxID=2099400 RepID=A0A2S9H4B7_9BURK|nr:hypothetical protein S2091_0029 [Solimicrobium silvestre]